VKAKVLFLSRNVFFKALITEITHNYNVTFSNQENLSVFAQLRE